MQKNYKISIWITSIMLFGIILSSLFVYNSYSKVIKDSTRNVAELSSMNIYSELNNELTKPIYVSLTMANDSFLKTWIENESSTNTEEIVGYLEGIKTKYEYNSVFLVSSDSLNYYHYNGVQKVISPIDEHDVWYYSFIEQTNIYDLDVDVDEVTGTLTIFVNVKVFDDFGNVIAIVGVGLEMEHIQEIMSDFEEEYDLEVYLTNEDGLVQSHSITSNIESLNIFELIEEDLKQEIITDSNELITTTNEKENKFIISRLVDEINWYLVITKDTNVLSRFFFDYFLVTIVMVILIISLILLIVIKSLNQYQNKIYTLAKTDYLTLLLNRRGFDDEYEKVDGSQEALVFITDIDRFKVINDKYGHTKGDEVLRSLAKIIDTEVSKYGKLSRWGGDEFTGVMVGDRNSLEASLKLIFNNISVDGLLTEYGVSISMGYTYTTFDIALDEVLSKADKGLYLAKSKGGNCIEFVE